MITIFLIGLGSTVLTEILKRFDTIADLDKWTKRGLVFLFAYIAVLVKNHFGVEVPESVLAYLVAAVWPAVIAAFNSFGLYEWYASRASTTAKEA
jgi:hypothetical protein